MTPEFAALLAGSRAVELRAEADAERSRPRCRRGWRAGPALRRWYARLWWAARPRAAGWAPELLGN